MTRILTFFLCAVVVGCAATSDPPTPSGATAPFAAPLSSGDVLGSTDPSQSTQPGSPNAVLDSRDVAILTVEQSKDALRVIASNKRPRSSFGPSAAWNGNGRVTHTWRLVGAGGETKASGNMTVHAALEAPPNPSQGAVAAHAERDVFSFNVKVPQPESGESIEISAASPSTLLVRWP